MRMNPLPSYSMPMQAPLQRSGNMTATLEKTVERVTTPIKKPGIQSVEEGRKILYACRKGLHFINNGKHCQSIESFRQFSEGKQTSF